MRISDALEFLQRFPQEAALVVCGDRGIEDLRVFAPTGEKYPKGTDPMLDGFPIWEYYKLDAKDEELPWLR